MLETKPYDPYPDGPARLRLTFFGMLAGVSLTVLVTVVAGQFDRSLLVPVGIAVAFSVIFVGSSWLWIYPIATLALIWVHEREQPSVETGIATERDSGSAGAESFVMNVRIRASLDMVMATFIGLLVGLVAGDILVLFVFGLGTGVALAAIWVAMWFFYRSHIEAKGFRW